MELSCFPDICARTFRRICDEGITGVFELHVVIIRELLDNAVLIEFIVNALNAVCEEVSEIAAGIEISDDFHAAGYVLGVGRDSKHTVVHIFGSALRILENLYIVILFEALDISPLAADDSDSEVIGRLGSLGTEPVVLLDFLHELDIGSPVSDAEERSGRTVLTCNRARGKHISDDRLGSVRCEIVDSDRLADTRIGSYALVRADNLDELLRVVERGEIIGIIVVLVHHLLVQNHEGVLADHLIVENSVCSLTDLSGREKRRVDVRLKQLGGRRELLVERRQNFLLCVLLEHLIIGHKEDIELIVLDLGIESRGQTVLVEHRLVGDFLSGILGGSFSGGCGFAVLSRFLLGSLLGFSLGSLEVESFLNLVHLLFEHLIILGLGVKHELYRSIELCLGDSAHSSLNLGDSFIGGAFFLDAPDGDRHRTCNLILADIAHVVFVSARCRHYCGAEHRKAERNAYKSSFHSLFPPE